MRMASCFPLALALAAACSQTESDGLLTTGIHADITARGQDGTTRVTATLRSGGAASLTFVNLVGDDHLEAESGGQTRRMTESELLDVVSYGVDFDGVLADTAFRVGLVRTVDDGAPSSTASLPEPFVLAGTVQATSRAATIELAFEPVTPGDPIFWELEGPCIARASGSLDADTDALQLPAGMVVANVGQEAETCELELELTRRRTGTLDPGYDGGTIYGEQREVVRFDSTP